MKKETKYVAFSTQKGGAGKTTITVLVASYLHYVKGYNVGVIDCDYPQHSIIEMRERDLKMALEDDHYKGMAYDQFTIADADHLITQGNFDFIFFDLPGTLNNNDLIHTLARMDYIIAPISADRVVLESTLNYMIVVKDHLMKNSQSNIKALYLLWNLVDGREKTELYEVYEKVMKDLDFSILKTFLPDTKRFRREQSISHKALFRSTLFPADRALERGSNLESLVDELLELLK